MRAEGALRRQPREAHKVDSRAVADESLTTGRLRLVPLPPEAAAALPNDRDRAARLIGASLSDDWPQPDLFAILPRHVLLGPDTAAFGIWVIVERESGTVIGDIGFRGPPDGSRSVEIGYSIVPAQRRRGYMTEAGRAITAWAQQQPGVDTVVARCDADNQASIRTLEAIGFTSAGAADGQLRWRL